MKKHFSTLILLLLVIGLIFGCVYTLKLVVSRGNQIAALQQENQDLKQAIIELNNRIEDLQDSKVIKPESNTETQEPVVEKTTVSIVPVLDTTKVNGIEEGTVLTEKLYDSNNIISVSADNASNTITINLNADMARQVYGYNGQSDTHTIAGLSTKVADVKIMSVGNNASDVKVMLLMEDGTIKYVNISSILDKTYSVQAVPELTDVVKIAEVNMTKEDKTTYGVVALKADGTSTIIKW